MGGLWQVNSIVVAVEKIFHRRRLPSVGRRDRDARNGQTGVRARI